MGLKYQQPQSIRLEDRFYLNSCLATKMKEKEHGRQKYITRRKQKDQLKGDYQYALS